MFKIKESKFKKNKNIKFIKLSYLFYVLFIFIFAVSFLFFSSSCSRIQSAFENNIVNNSNTQEQTIANSTQTTEISNLAQNDNTIEIWDSCKPKERVFLAETINNFLKQNQNYKINTRHFKNEEELVDVFTASSLAGDGPEIILASFDSMRDLAKNDVIKDLTNEVNFNIFLPGLDEISNINNKNYIIPFSSSDFLVFYYNKSLVKKIPSNFDDIISISKELLSSKDQKYGLLLNAQEPEWDLPFLGGYLDWFYEYSTGDVTLNSNAMEKTLDFINNIYNVEKIIPKNMGYEDMNNLFKSGKAAMFINGVWAIDEYKSAGIDFGILKIPKVSDAITSPTPMISGLGFMINNNISNKSFEIAKKFINYMISPDVQTGWTLNTQSFPALLGLETEKLSSDNNLYNILLQAKICRGKPYEEDLRIIRDVLRFNIGNLISGNINASSAKEKMQEDYIKLKSGKIQIEDYSSTKETTNQRNTGSSTSKTINTQAQ